jgi:hypothetical protein
MDILSLFQTNGFLINVAITLLLVGVVVYYFRNKIKHLENSQIEQAKVLQSFIRKMSLENGGLTEESSNSNQMTNDSVVNSANLYIDNEKTEKTDKIDVSDDSESESESDTDSESDADEETQQIVNKVLMDTDVKKITINETTEGKLNNDVESNQVEETVMLNVNKVSDMTEEVSNEMMDNEHESASSSESDSDSDSDFDSEDVQEVQDKDSENKTMESETSKEDVQEVQEKNGETENVDDNTDVNTDDVVEKTNIKSETLQYSRMKVNALRDLAVENNLIENDAAKKKKKKELVELLEASTTM